MEDDFYDDDGFDDVQQERSDGEWAKLRRAEKAKKQAEADAEAARRELAFYKAGISPDDPKATYFVKGYDGDMTPDAIRKAAEEAGFIDAPDIGEVDLTPVDAGDRVVDAATGAAEVDSAMLDIAAAFNEGGMEALAEALRSAGAVVNDVQ